MLDHRDLIGSIVWVIIGGEVVEAVLINVISGGYQVMPTKAPKLQSVHKIFLSKPATPPDQIEGIA